MRARRRFASHGRPLLLVTVAGVAALVMACTPAPPGGGTTTTSTSTSSSTTTTIPPVTSRVYMTDNIDLSAPAARTLEAAVDIRVTTRGCSDYDSCLDGSRRSSGYTWFSAFAVNVGPSTTSADYYGMHGGLAFGGSGAQSKLYLDWSGYCPSTRGGGPLRDGGTSCSSGGSNPTYKPHTVLDLAEGTWYTLSIRSVPCSVSEVSDISGPLTGWEAVLTDLATGASRSGGTWCLPNAPYVAHTSLFNEIIEYRGPCATDFGTVEFRDPRYRTASGWHGHTSARGHYNGNDTDLDANCSDTNLRVGSSGQLIDERMMARGSMGGLVDDGYLFGG
jgi:hypothetical protein